LLLQLKHFLLPYLGFLAELDHRIIINLLPTMISSEKVRPSMQITLADIFQDFNDPRKDLLAKRVALVLSDQEKRLMS
jgi:hypothetical protein